MLLIHWQKMPILAALSPFILSSHSAHSNPIFNSRRHSIEPPMEATTAVASNGQRSGANRNSSRLDPKKTLLTDIQCQNPGTQAEINNCAVLFAKAAEQAMNQAYQKLRSTLSASQEKLLVKAQNAWIRFRDDQCALEKSFYAGGSLSITSQLDCRQRLSDGRERELKRLLGLQRFQGKTQGLQPREATVSEAPVRPDAASLVGSDRIGPAVIGNTMAELRKALGKTFSLQSRQQLMVDIDAIPIARSGRTELYVLFPAGTSISDSSVIQSLLTRSSNFRTIEGVGPGMKLSAVERIYGKPTLAYNTSNESREYVTFSKQPSSHIRFGVKRVGSGLAGIYARPKQEYNQTHRYQELASIDFLQVSLR